MKAVLLNCAVAKASRAMSITAGRRRSSWKPVRNAYPVILPGKRPPRPNISYTVLPIPQYAFFEQAIFHDLFRQSLL